MADGSRPRPETTPPTARPSKPPSPARRRRRRPRQRPSPGSLSDLLRQHPGTGLFVRPICWTDLHARLLGAEFEELPPCDAPLPFNQPDSPPSQGHMRPSPAITILSNALSEILQPSAVQSILSSNAVKTTLITLWPGAFSRPQYLPELNIFWGGKVYHDAVRVQAMWNFPSELSRDSSQVSFETVATHPSDSQQLPPPSSSPSSSAARRLEPASSSSSSSSSSSPSSSNSISSSTAANLPMMCYVGKNRSTLIRRSMFRVCQGPGMLLNLPVYRLQQLRAKALMPLDPNEDVIFVGIFLAMAQRHFYGAPPPSPPRRESYWWPRDNGRPPRPDFHDLKLRILTSDHETAEFIVYTGHVTAAFLDRFHDPSRNPPAAAAAAAADDHDDHDHDAANPDRRPPGIKIEYTRVPVWPILGLRERLGTAIGQDIVGAFDPTQMETWQEPETETELDTGSSEDEEALFMSGERARAAPRRKRSRGGEELARVVGGYEEGSDAEGELATKKRRLDEGNRVGVVV